MTFLIICTKYNIINQPKAKSQQITKMPKFALYYSPSQLVLLQSQQQRLKSLQALYQNELTIRAQVPQKFSPKESYIRLTNSEAEPVVFTNLRATIVYCLKLDGFKKREIQARYKGKAQETKIAYGQRGLYITNQFKDIIVAIVKQLGYYQPTSTLPQVPKKSNPQINPEIEQSRFDKQNMQKQVLKQYQQMLLRQQLVTPSNIKQISKLFKLSLTQNIESTPIEQLSASLEKELTQYLKGKELQIFPKEFAKIKQAKNVRDLAHACLYFYTLQKYLLYHDLNFLLRNIRSLVFRQQLQKLKLFGFLLLLNYLYVYSGTYGIQQTNPPQTVYRYTDSIISPQLTNKIITIPSFYSTSSKEFLPQFAKKSTKIIIHPLLQNNNSISVRSMYPVHLYSAFKGEGQYLYLPFTCFLVTQVRCKKGLWTVDLKQVPGNTLVRNIFDANLFNAGHSITSDNLLSNYSKMGSNGEYCQFYTSEWQLRCQQRYQFSKDPVIKIKTSFNLGLIYLRLIQKYDISINYFIQGIHLIQDLISNLSPLTSTGPVTTLTYSHNNRLSHISMLVKGYNYLGLAYMKLDKLDKAQGAFVDAENYAREILDYYSNRFTTQVAAQDLNNNLAEPSQKAESIIDPVINKGSIVNKKTILNSLYNTQKKNPIQVPIKQQTKKQYSTPKLPKIGPQSQAQPQSEIKTKNKNSGLTFSEIEHVKQIPDQFINLIAGLRNNQSFLLEAQKQFPQAIHKYLEALKFLALSQNKNQLMEACIYNNIGACYGRIRHENKQVYQKQEEISINQHSPANDNKQQLINKREEAFQYFRKSFKLYLKVYGINPNFYHRQAMTVEEQQKQHSSAQKQLMKMSKSLIQSQILISQLIPILQNLSQYHQPTSSDPLPKSVATSIHYLSTAIALYLRLKLVQQKQSVTLMYMRSRYAKLLTKAERYKESIEIYEQLLPICRMIDASGLKSAMCKSNIASVYVNMGSDQDFRNAVYWYSQAIRDISMPLLSENLQFYNKISDLKADIQKYCINFKIENEQQIIEMRNKNGPQCKQKGGVNSSNKNVVKNK